MLAGETAVGRYPVRAVATLDAIVREAERMLEPGMSRGAGWRQLDRARPRAVRGGGDAGRSARGRAAIVAVTEAGTTARMLAALRPSRTDSGRDIQFVRPRRALALVWGVTPVVVEHTTLAAVRQALLTGGLVPPAHRACSSRCTGARRTKARTSCTSSDSDIRWSDVQVNQGPAKSSRCSQISEVQDQINSSMSSTAPTCSSRAAFGGVSA